MKTKRLFAAIVDLGSLISKKKIKNFSNTFYICGPDAMIESFKAELLNIGVNDEKTVTKQF